MRYFSMFSGIAGFEKGIEGVYPDAECVGFSEIDKNAEAIYKYHYPEHHNYGDATAINVSELPDFDFLVGGFPCQSFSIAGKRQGFEEARGTLFFEIARVLQAKKPRYILLENVKGLISHDNYRTITTIHRVLGDIGYEGGWVVCNSKHFGVPQNRERVFFIYNLRGERQPEILSIGESNGVNSEVELSRGVSSCITKSYHKGYNFDNQLIKVGQTSSDGSQAGTVFSEKGVSPTISAGTHGYANGYVSIATQRGREEGQKLEFPKGDYVVHNLQPRMGKGQGGKGHLQKSDGSTYCLDTGNGQAIEFPNPSLNTDGSVTALDASYYKGVGKRGNKYRAMASQDNSIRRLTPVECERLQSFPDNHTKYGNFNGVTKEMSDSARYKACGNAVTVNVIKALVKIYPF